MTEAEKKMVEDHIQKNGVTECIPVVAQGSELSRAVRASVAAKRAEWRKEHR